MLCKLDVGRVEEICNQMLTDGIWMLLKLDHFFITGLYIQSYIIRQEMDINGSFWEEIRKYWGMWK